MEERSRAAAVAGAHRVVRALGEGEGPFAGELVTRGDAVVVRIDATDLQGWAGWGHAGSEHIAAPLDLALRPDGQDILLPWCTCTAEAWVARRVSEAGGPSNGEAVTLVVSLLRGLDELAAGESVNDDGLPAGCWWIAADGRPLFVLGEGERADAATRRIAEALEGGAGDRALARTLARLRDALQDPRRLRAESSRWERELLEVAAPRPLRMAESGSDGLDRDVGSSPGLLRASRRDLRRERAASAAARHARPLPREAPPRRTALTGNGRPPGAAAMAAIVRRLATVALVWRPATLPGRASGAGWTRGKTPPPERRRRRWRGPLISAVGVAAAVAVLGALWPASPGPADAGDGRASSSDARTPSATSESAPPSTPATPSISPSPRGAAAPSTDGEPLVAAAALIVSARHCSAEPGPACERLWDAPGAAKPVRGVDEAPVLIEDYGDVAAVRNPAADGAQMVVIVRRNAEWRIRDVYDIADPPSEGAGAR